MEEIHGASKMNHHQPHQRPGFLPKKVMLYILWDWKRVLYHKLLLENQTINSNKYCSQLNQLKVALHENHLELINRKCIIFRQDNTRLHVFLMTRQKLLQLGQEVLIHPPYSPAVAPSDFHLFWFLKSYLNGKNFSSLKDCKRHLFLTVYFLSDQMNSSDLFIFFY